MDAVDGVEDNPSRNDVICFNGEDFRVQDLFGAGVMFNQAPDDDPLVSFDNDEQDIFGLDQAEEDNEMVQENISVIGHGVVPLKDIMTKRPPPCASLRQDPNFKNVVEDGRVRKKILQPGTGKQVAPDSKAWFHYVAFANNDPEWFDNTLERKPASARLEPPGGIIAGLRFALKTMHLMETAQILIHHSYGYGDVGCPPRIPPKATLICNVKIVAFIPVERLTYWQLEPEEKARISFSAILDIAKMERMKGAHKAECDMHWPAVRCFREGINLLESITTDNEEKNAQRCQVLAAIYGSLAGSYLELDRPEECCVACKKGLNLQIKEEMAYLLRVFAVAKLKFKSYEVAWKLAKRAEAELGSTGNQQEKLKVTTLISQIKTAIAEDKSVDPERYKNFFCTSQNG